MSFTTKAKIGKKRTLVVPKAIFEKLGLQEGDLVSISVEGGAMVVRPVRDAVWLSLRCEKFAKISPEEIGEESVEQQQSYIEERLRVIVDTSFLLPALGVDVGERVASAIELFKQVEVFYLEVSLLEAMWKLLRVALEKVLDRVEEGLKAIRETYSLLQKRSLTHTASTRQRGEQVCFCLP